MLSGQPPDLLEFTSDDQNLGGEVLLVLNRPRWIVVSLSLDRVYLLTTFLSPSWPQRESLISKGMVVVDHRLMIDGELDASGWRFCLDRR